MDVLSGTLQIKQSCGRFNPPNLTVFTLQKETIKRQSSNHKLQIIPTMSEKSGEWFL